MTQQATSPTPDKIWQAITAFQMSAAIKAAIELGLFTAIAEGRKTAAAIAASADAAERGVRIICDTMSVLEFLTKSGEEYSLADDAAVFLVRTSPAYMGDVVNFILSPQQKSGFDDLTASVRRGGADPDKNVSLDPDSPMWATFARSMTALMMPSAMQMAADLDYEVDAPLKVLDIAAGHGMFGLSIAQRYPNAHIYAVDWANVLPVAAENAEKIGVADRYHTIPGSAFDVDLGDGYDVVLITNFLHHFDPSTCVLFLNRIAAAIKEDGRALTLEFVPNDDRISPPVEALFPLVMLAATPAGDAYTYAELRSMFEKAGFASSEHRPMPDMPQHWIVSRK